MSGADSTLLEIEDLREQLQGLREKIEGDDDLFQLLQSKADELRSSMRASLRISLAGSLAASSRGAARPQPASPPRGPEIISSKPLPPRPVGPEEGEASRSAERVGSPDGAREFNGSGVASAMEAVEVAGAAGKGRNMGATFTGRDTEHPRGGRRGAADGAGVMGAPGTPSRGKTGSGANTDIGAGLSGEAVGGAKGGAKNGGGSPIGAKGGNSTGVGENDGNCENGKGGEDGGNYDSYDGYGGYGGDWVPPELFKLLVDRVDLLEDALQRARDDNKNLLSIINSVALNTVKITRVLPKIDGKVSKVAGGLAKSQEVIVTLNRVLEENAAASESRELGAQRAVGDAATRISALESRLSAIEASLAGQGKAGVVSDGLPSTAPRSGESLPPAHQRLASSNIIDVSEKPERPPRLGSAHGSGLRGLVASSVAGRRFPDHADRRSRPERLERPERDGHPPHPANPGYTIPAAYPAQPGRLERPGPTPAEDNEPVVRAEHSLSPPGDTPQNSSVIHQKAAPRSFAAATPSIFSGDRTPPRSREEEGSRAGEEYASAIYRPAARSPGQGGRDSSAPERSLANRGNKGSSLFSMDSAEFSATVGRSATSLPLEPPAASLSEAPRRPLSRGAWERREVRDPRDSRDVREARESRERDARWRGEPSASSDMFARSGSLGGAGGAGGSFATASGTATGRGLRGAGYEAPENTETLRGHASREDRQQRSTSGHQRRKDPGYLSSDFLALARKLEAAIDQCPM